MSSTHTRSATMELRLDLLLEVASELLRAADPAAVVSAVAQRACEVVGCEVFINYLLVNTRVGPRLRLNSSDGLPLASRPDFEWYELGNPVCGIVAQSGKERVWDGSAEGWSPLLVEKVAPLGLRAYACFPLLIGDRVLGTLGFGLRSRAEFTPDEIALLRSVAGPIALAMERVESETALRAARDAAEAARAAAEAASLAKDRFIATLSHELRTPLTPIATTLTLLDAHPDLPADVREDLALIRRNLDNETRLIDDLLDFNRIARGKIDLRKEAVDLPQLVLSTLRSFRHPFDEKKIRLEVSVPEAFEPVPADPLRLRQILVNLLTNALKFTSEHGVVSIGLALTTLGRARITVSDNGMGIPPELMPHLFNPFEQGTRPSRPRPDGLGLGLAISRSLALLHQGTLEAQSDGEGLGATFTLELPIGRTTAERVPPEGEEPGGPTTPMARGAVRTRLLLVEDHADTLSILSRYLTSAGYDVTAASSVGEAVRAFTDRPADLLVSDIGLPDGSGLGLLGRLRAVCPGLPAIAISGFGMDDDLRRSLEAGFSLHLTKPVDLNQLTTAVARLAAPDASPAARFT